ncbi:SLC30A1 [Mytilus edulis]|uniref:SLC30A1 n=1 Tax=Mytilus edulis TaxID=6550 RepID=A0A8S3TV57_MYTED|nr:SLC30A1 [Mytilus edulis]
MMLTLIYNFYTSQYNKSCYFISVRDSGLILLQTVPGHIRVHKLKEDIEKIEGVLALHEFHVWQLAGNKIIASAHIHVHNLQEYMVVAEKLKDIFHKAGIHSTTIQPEIIDEFDAVDFPKNQNCSLECGPNKNCLVDTCCAPKSKQELARRSSKENSPTRSSPNHNKLKTSASSPCFDYVEGVLTCHVDDFLWGGSKEFEEKVINSIRSTFCVGKEELEENGSFPYVGTELSKHENDFLLDKTLIIIISSLFLLKKVVWESKENFLPKKKENFYNLKRDKYFGLQDKVDQIDSSLGNLSDGGTQGGHFIVLVGENGLYSPITWQIKRIRRVARSTLAAETLAMADAIDSGIFIASLYTELMYGKADPTQLPITCLTDCHSLWVAIKSTKRVSEKRLRLEISSIR